MDNWDERGLTFPKFDQGSIFCPTFQKIGTRFRLLATHVDQLFSYGDTVHLKILFYGSSIMADPPIFVLRADLSLYLHCTEDSTSSEQIEGHLPEKAIDAVLDKPGKPGAESIGVQVA